MGQTFGESLRAIRKQKGLSQLQLATKAGLHFTYISKIEKNLVPPPAANTIVKLCSILEIPPEQLLVLARKTPAEFVKAISSSRAALEFVRRAQSMGLSEGEWQNLTQELRRLRRRTIANLQPGEHVCYIYETEKEHKALLTPFLRQGLERGEKVVYIADTHTAKTIQDYLRDDGLKVKPYLTTGQLSIRGASEVYTRGGVFDPDAMIALLRAEIERALSEGHSALRVTGEMSWVLRGLPGSERLIEYENKLNTFFPGTRCLGLCQYDRQRFGAELLLDVVVAHPTVVLGAEIHSNPFYVLPTELLGKKRSIAALLHQLDHVAMPREQPKDGGSWTMTDFKPLILAVDDEPNVLQLFRRVLEPAGYQVMTAADGDQCLQLVAEKAPELVLLDIKMPGKSGIEVLADLKKSYPGVTVIMASGIGDVKTAIEAIKTGAFDYLVKPFNMSEILLTVERALENKRLLQWRVEAEKEKQRLEARSRQEKARLETVLNSVTDGVYVVDRNLNITQWSPSAERITGWSAIQVTGKRCSDFFFYKDEHGKPLCGTPDCPVALSASDMKQVGPRRVTASSADGKTLVLSVTTAPVEDESGEIGRVLCVFHDISTEVEVERLKNQLLSTVSHELRTPLAGIKGYTTMLLDYDKKLRPAEKREYLRTIDSTADRLAELIEHLLDMSRLDAGLLRLEITPGTVDGIIRDTVAGAQLRAPAYTIKAELKEELPLLRLDARRIRQVLDNLLDNAIKYSSEGTTVVVRAEHKGGEVEISVTDQGRGIPVPELNRVFDRMYRIEQRLSQDPGGLGLGLALCKALVEAHKGRIWLQSGEGKGTTAYFTLPVFTEEAPRDNSQR